MRLICPGCAAQYEVQQSAIPPEGRDVQCSNCGHAWFQRGPLPDGTLPQDRDADVMARTVRAMAEPQADAGDSAMAADAASDARPVDGTRAEEATPDISEDAPAPPPAEIATDRDPADLPAPPAGQPVPGQRKIDESVLSVLREEAEREARARRAEAASLESQPDLGLAMALQPQAAPRRQADRTTTISDPVQGQEIAPRRSVRPEATRSRGDGPAQPDRAPAPVPDADDSPGRRKRLPDIEEINSTLRGAADRGGAGALSTDAAIEARIARRGFRTGFVVVLGLVALALAVYLLALPLAAAVPALAPTLESYSAAVDALRLLLARQVEAGMRGLLAWMS